MLNININKVLDLNFSLQIGSSDWLVLRNKMAILEAILFTEKQ